MNKKIKILSLILLLFVSGCGAKTDGDNTQKENKDGMTTTENYDLCNNYAVPLEYNEEFEEIFGKLKGEWISEDGLVCITISKEDEEYLYSIRNAELCEDVFSENGSIYSMSYSEEVDVLLKESEKPVSILMNLEIMQSSAFIVLDNAGTYIKFFGYDNAEIVLYPYERTISKDFDVTKYIDAANIADTLQKVLAQYNFDFYVLRDTALQMIHEQSVSYAYEDYTIIEQETEDGIVLKVKCRKIENNPKYSIKDIDLRLTIDKQGSFISLEDITEE